MHLERDDTETRGLQGLGKGDVRGVVEVVLGEQPTVETCVDKTAKLRPQASILALRAAGANKLLKPASTAPRSYGQRHRPWHHGHLNVTHNGGAAGNGLYTTIKYMRSASGIGMDTTIKHLRRTTSGAARNVLGASVKYLRRTTSAAANNGLSTTIDPPLVVQRVFSKLRAPRRGTSLGPFVCGARACSLCS